MTISTFNLIPPMYSLLHQECHFFSLKSQSLVSFSRSLLPRSIEKRPMRFRLEIENGWHSKCNRLCPYSPQLSFVPFFILSVSFSRSLLPRSIEKRPMRFRLERMDDTPNGWHSKCNRLCPYSPYHLLSFVPFFITICSLLYSLLYNYRLLPSLFCRPLFILSSLPLYRVAKTQHALSW